RVRTRQRRIGIPSQSRWSRSGKTSSFGPSLIRASLRASATVRLWLIQSFWPPSKRRWTVRRLGSGGGAVGEGEGEPSTVGVKKRAEKKETRRPPEAAAAPAIARRRQQVRVTMQPLLSTHGAALARRDGDPRRGPGTPPAQLSRSVPRPRPPR